MLHAVEALEPICFHLLVKWSSASGLGEAVKVRMNRLDLTSLDNVDKLGGLARGLIDRNFPSEAPRPDYLTSDQFSRYTPVESCLSYPLDVVKTEFKLVASYRGWEYVIHVFDPATTRDRPISLLSPELKRLFVTVVEFESVAIVLGNLGVRISLVAYPVISIDKVFLDEVRTKLRTDPTYKGVLC